MKHNKSYRPWLLRLLTAVVLSAALVAILLRQTSLREIVMVLAGGDWRMLLLAFGIYALANLFKALRLRLATTTDGHQINMVSIFETACIYNLATGILPFGSGELSYPHLMRRWHGIYVSQSGPALVITRLFDLITVSLLFLVSTLLIRDTLIIPHQLILAALILLALTTLLLLLAPWVGRRALEALELVSSRWLGPYLQKLSNRLIKAGLKSMDNLAAVYNWQHTFYLILYSGLIWLLSYWVFQLIFLALGREISFWLSCFGGSLAIMTNLLPVQGVAGLGIREAGWFLGLTSAGFSASGAVVLAFSIHAVSLSYMVILGLMAMSFRPIRRKITGTWLKGEAT